MCARNRTEDQITSLPWPLETIAVLMLCYWEKAAVNWFFLKQDSIAQKPQLRCGSSLCEAMSICIWTCELSGVSAGWAHEGRAGRGSGLGVLGCTWLSLGHVGGPGQRWEVNAVLPTRASGLCVVGISVWPHLSIVAPTVVWVLVWSCTHPPSKSRGRGKELNFSLQEEKRSWDIGVAETGKVWVRLWGGGTGNLELPSTLLGRSARQESSRTPHGDGEIIKQKTLRFMRKLFREDFLIAHSRVSVIVSLL